MKTAFIASLYKVTENEEKEGGSGVGEKEKNKNKMRYEKIIMNISLIGSILFMLSEGFMAYYTKSHSLLIDCIFDVTDLIMIGPFMVLVPLCISL